MAVGTKKQTLPVRGTKIDKGMRVGDENSQV